MKRIASSAGTSTPSDRQRALVRMRQVCSSFVGIEILGDDCGELVLHEFGGRDVLAEGERAQHRAGIREQVRLQPVLRQRLVAPDDLGGVVELELRRAVGKPPLHAGADHLLVDRENEHLVVGE
jgi:hypothetical protein